MRSRTSGAATVMRHLVATTFRVLSGYHAWLFSYVVSNCTPLYRELSYSIILVQFALTDNSVLLYIPNPKANQTLL